MKNIKIKICGQRNLAVIDHCLKLNIDYQGLIFYPKSPRAVNTATLKNISESFNEFSQRFVGVFVNPTVNEISKHLDVFDFGVIQLHGSETEENINEIKNYFKKPIFKSISPEEFNNQKYNSIDYYLIESKPNERQLPGGNNQSWNWSNFKNLNNLPFILSGGLNLDNVKQAISLTGANFIDINSGIEIEMGEKTISLIEEITSLIHS